MAKKKIENKPITKEDGIIKDALANGCYYCGLKELSLNEELVEILCPKCGCVHTVDSWKYTCNSNINHNAVATWVTDQDVQDKKFMNNLN